MAHVRILGIHDGYNSCAALIVDGRPIVVVQEERLTGVKNFAGFPHQAVKEVLRLGQCDAAQIDFIALNGQHIGVPVNGADLLRKFEGYTSGWGKMRRLARSTIANDVYRRWAAQRRIAEVAAAGLDVARVKLVEHHAAHAAAAYYGSPWRGDPVLVLTCDGGGDELCATVNIGRDGGLTRLASIPDSDSLGVLYAIITFLLGMMPNEHEYKLMGLAPYAPSRGADTVYQALRGYLILSSRNPLIWERGRGYPNAYEAYPYLRRLLERRRFDWICAGLQQFTEELLVGWVRNCVRETGVSRVALSGGVGMNVKANKRIAELAEVQDLFVFPSCTDESNAIGAAWHVYTTESSGGRFSIPPLGPLYLGPEFSAADYDDAVREAHDGFTIRQMDDPECEIADLLARGEVVARFDGRMEFGARALGNRSILADASTPRVVRIINDMIKSRDFWMPFAPSVLDYAGPRYVRNPKQLRYPYMILAFDANGDTAAFEAAIHPYDRTVRPQEVYAEWNAPYYRLIQEFEQRTGRGIILNTSFNLHGFPLVCTPRQAIDVFVRSGLEYLALGPYLLTKR